MSAPDHAKPIGGPITTIDGLIIPEESIPRIICRGCGWKGKVTELLGVDDEDTMWCPQCRTSGWEYD